MAQPNDVIQEPHPDRLPPDVSEYTLAFRPRQFLYGTYQAFAFIVCGASKEQYT